MAVVDFTVRYIIGILAKEPEILPLETLPRYPPTFDIRLVMKMKGRSVYSSALLPMNPEL